LIQPYTQAGAAVKTDIRTFGTGPGENFASVGGSGLFVVNKRPHPNATRVFVNWLLSKDVQHEFAKAVQQDSRRTDLDSIAPPDQQPRRGVKYFTTQREEDEATMEKAQKTIAELRKQAN
jgi:ABC-type Fe3+ transport system substrate-binding protein